MMKIFRSRHDFIFISLIFFIIAVGCLRICSTYSVFWQTWDEPFHIAAGMEWLDKGQYTYERFHPPLARVMSALGLYLNGIRGIDEVSRSASAWSAGNAILHTDGKYEQNLVLARIGILPFFIIASFVVALWTKKCSGTTASLVATLLFTTLPPILAHSSVATLDMACSAFVATALFSLTLWLTKPTLWHSCFLGITTGLAILSKLSAIGFLFVGGGLTLIIYGLDYFRKRHLENSVFPNFRKRFVTAVLALIIFALTIWAGYRFSIEHLVTMETRPHEKVDNIVGTKGLLHDAAYFMLENIKTPAPEFTDGIDDFLNRNQSGHLTYFMGNVRTDGWWYFFPTIFLFKTPLAFMLLSVFGFSFIFRNAFLKNPGSLQLLVPAISSIGILALSTLGSVNNGLRQVLSIYPLLAIVAGYGAYKLIFININFKIIGIGFVTALCSWQLISSFNAHPDYLAYFNILARNHPEEIVVDSDLDWGQDLKRLALTLENRGINEFKIQYNGSRGINLDQFNLPRRQQLKPYQRETGWIAISIFKLKLGNGKAPYDQFSWLREYQPIEKVGKSIWLYYIPEN